jgi:hypothetical protein
MPASDLKQKSLSTTLGHKWRNEISHAARKGMARHIQGHRRTGFVGASEVLGNPQFDLGDGLGDHRTWRIKSSLMRARLWLRRVCRQSFWVLTDEHGFKGGNTMVKNYAREHGRRNREMFVPLPSYPERRPRLEPDHSTGDARHIIGQHGNLG